MIRQKMFKNSLSLAMFFFIATCALTLRAQESDKDYCDKVQARAHADAWLLFSPSIQIQAIRYPAAGTITVVGGSTDANGDQLRANLSWSPLDALRGTHLLTVADKDCLQHSATQEADNLLEQMNDIGRAAALQAEVSYLLIHIDSMNGILAQMRRRLGIGTVTIIDVASMQSSMDSLYRKLAVSQGQLGTIRSRDYVTTIRSSSEIVAMLQKYSMEFENESGKLRIFDPWTVTLSGGIVPPMSGVDSVSWYGMIGVGYNFGGLRRGHYEDQYQSARYHEIGHARYEVADQIRRLRDGIRAGIESASMEIESLDKRLANLHNMKTQLSSFPDAPNVMSISAMIEFQTVDIESDRAFLVTLRDRLREWK